MTFISRYYESEKNKGYLNDYEKYETQVLTIHSTDTRAVPFKVWGYSGDNINITPYTPANQYELPSNSISVNSCVMEDGLRVDFSVTANGIEYLFGDVRVYYDGIFYVPIVGLDKGNYTLKLVFRKAGFTYTTVIPLIST